ncbi:MAG: hypothetical protein ACK40K_07945 [Raineya sp.]
MQHLLFGVLLFTLICSTKGVYAQSVKDEELIKFYHLYKYELDNPFDLVNILPQCVKKVNISEKRMEEIFQAQALGRDPKFSEVEKQEMVKLEALMKIEKEKYDAEFAKKIKEKGLTAKRYEEIKKKFHSDTALQQKTYRLVQK